MATLHVRNVPDDLYEKLRHRAERNGRSIGAETVVLLEAQLVMLPTHGGRRGRRSFVPSARHIVWDAQEEARELGHERVDTEHLLLAVLGATTTELALRASVGLDYAEARAEVERRVGRGEPTEGERPVGPRGRAALELALRESLDEGGRGITHRHVLIGILREGEGIGARIVADREPDLDGVIARVRAAGPAVPPTLVVGPGPRTVQRPFRVVELEGTPERWEKQLNDLAQLGYGLMQIVERRAVFAVPDVAP